MTEFRLVEKEWDEELGKALASGPSVVQLICPFIKKGVAERLVGRRPSSIRVITRFSLEDFSEKVSDIDALRVLLANGAKIRGIKQLHSKVYVFDKERAIVTSANLTDAGLRRNHEFGFVATGPDIVSGCQQYFDGLWERAGPDLTVQRLNDWEEKINRYLAKGTKPTSKDGLGDEGIDANENGTPNTPELSSWFQEVEQSFVKFFGNGADRVDHLAQVQSEVESSGCHWACTYPKGKRPRQVGDGAIVYMARLVRDPTDIVVYGRAVAMKYQEGRDDASASDLAVRPWKSKWPHYIRVHHAEFVDGSLLNGVSLNALMNELGASAFLPTQKNAESGYGNTDPRRSYMRKPGIELAAPGHRWLSERLEQAFVSHGKLSPEILAAMDWPNE